ncbi:chromosomal replication initiator DnaA [Paracoccus suum]|uniref:Chromosomal replication initiator DnaA n=1 Tax=Paracoccus suum TaxID=2259340 RepID=A0A344PLA8_9RHOB|nr:DnaA/Hda family protein [Paracoccus suum]AXC50163.1 chromosomal replication initiator DnaA [Paracoccus suum]
MQPRTPRQLSLDLATPPALGRGDFLVAPSNSAALAALDAPADWPGGRLVLLGPEGSGKSHLAAIWAAENGARRVSAAALHPEMADNLMPEGAALVIEDAHRAGGAAGAEQSLFHLWNLSAARQGLLLLTASTAPRDWGLVLPDLRSRMDALPQVVLGPPDEALLGAVLVKLFADRQLEVAPDVIDALVLRMDRDLGLARRLVAAIDEASLAEGRRITRRLALEALDGLTSGLDATAALDR